MNTLSCIGVVFLMILAVSVKRRRRNLILCVISTGDILGGQLAGQVGLSALSRSETQLFVGQRT